MHSVEGAITWQSLCTNFQHATCHSRGAARALQRRVPGGAPRHRLPLMQHQVLLQPAQVLSSDPYTVTPPAASSPHKTAAEPCAAYPLCALSCCQLDVHCGLPGHALSLVRFLQSADDCGHAVMNNGQDVSAAAVGTTDSVMQRVPAGFECL